MNDNSKNKVTPQDLRDLGYSPEWVALSGRISASMRLKALRQEASARKAEQKK